MAKLTLFFGLALVVLGVVFFVSTGSAHPTALIPVWFGIALAICGLLAKTENPSRRMLWMHIAVTIGLIGFLFPLGRAMMTVSGSHSTGIALSTVAITAVHEELWMGGICLLFVALCIRSFINARRSRTA